MVVLMRVISEKCSRVSSVTGCPLQRTDVILKFYRRNDISNTEICVFRDTMEALGLTQQVSLATHKSGNILDLVFSEVGSDYTILNSSPDVFVSDHKSIITSTSIFKDNLKRKKLTVRKTKGVSMQSLREEFKPSNIPEISDVNAYAAAFEEELTRLFNKFSPEKEITVTDRKLNPWYNSFIRDQKKVVRSREKTWHKYRQEHQWKAYQKERNRLNFMITFEKKQSISGKVLDCGRDTKWLYCLINSITNSSPCNPLPRGDPHELAEGFAEFFLNKILKIREGFEGTEPYQVKGKSTLKFNKFPPLTVAEVTSIIGSMQTKSCESDCIPTSWLKELLPNCIEILTRLVNLSLDSGIFVQHWKEAIVRPLLKKLGLALQDSNYRPVSNLPFLSKLLERAMLFHFTKYCDEFGLMPDFQSAYRPNYSCETALLSVCKDALCAMEKQQVMAMTVMDLSAAFDTVDHTVLLDILENKFGLGGQILNWFSTYLQPRSFKVCVENQYSTVKPLNFSVPQGSASGAYIFLCYASPIEEVIPADLSLNGFADDHSVRYKFKAGNRDQELCMEQLMNICMVNVKEWMTSMRLKLNDSKTEFIIFGSTKQVKKLATTNINVNGCEVPRTPLIKYLGSWLDENLNFKHHITKKCQTAMYNVFKIRNIRKFLTKEACHTIMLGLVISHLDYNNALLYGLPDVDINRLQRVQNIAAKIVCDKRKYDSVTDCLRELHWLPIRARIEHKILSLTHGCVYGYGPTYLQDLVNKRTAARALRSNYDENITLTTPFTKHKTFKERSFSCAAPKLWNNLPSDVKSIASKETFKKATKTILFNKYFNSNE